MPQSGFRVPQGAGGQGLYIETKVSLICLKYLFFGPWPPGGPRSLIDAYSWHIFTLLTNLELGNILVLM